MRDTRIAAPRSTFVGLIAAALVVGGCASAAPELVVQPAPPLTPERGLVPAPATPERGLVPEPPLPGALAIPQTPAQPEGLIAVAAVSATIRPERRDVTAGRVDQLSMPPGFRVAIFADGLENPRSIVVAGNGDIYVAEREAGRVRLLRDTNGDGRADVSRVVLEGMGEKLEGVHGLAIRQGDARLYMVTVRELYSSPIRNDGSLGSPVRHIDDLPDGGQHPNRTLRWGPDGFLYISVGSQTNGVPEPDEETATLLRVDPNTWQRRIHAEGLRNTIGFGWHPVAGALYGLDHNTDHRGDNWPPEELNRISDGHHYGWPFCGGFQEVDWHVAANPDGGNVTREAFCARTEPPVLTYTAHAAPMQMVFYTGSAFPAEYRNDAFVAMRGSWNRNPPVGYEVVRIRFDDAGVPVAMEPFVSGWLIEDGRAHFGRPMGLAQAADGSLLMGDDENGVIYRISYDATRP
jgi:glucose/arabinose dehydrogenase